MSAMPSFLVHVSDTEPGIKRRVRGRGFSYHHPDGTNVECESTLTRIRGLGLPPAWREVWICAHDHGHIQATGRDARGRKQYRYHDSWRVYRDQLKYEGLAEFGAALPALRARVRRDLARNRPDKPFVCAALVRLLDQAALRVGSEAYARENGSFGATTLREKHVRLGKGKLNLDFTAKGGKRVRKQVRDRTLHRALERIGDLPGRELFHYIGEDGSRHGLDSADVNSYIHTTLPHATAKTFRTWRGSVEAFAEARDTPTPTIKALCERAADALHNTPAIARTSYIHPDVIALAEMDSEARAAKLEAVEGTRRDGLRVDEAEFLALIGE